MSSDTKGLADAAAHDLSAIRRDISSLRDSLAGLTRGLSREVADTVTARGGRAVDAIGRQIDEQPVWSLVLACSVGVLFSRVLWR